jgi:RNA polymerase sigma-70 factor (ECF subfamily)
VSASDADVIGRVRLGERNAFSELVQRYQRRLFGLTLMMVRDTAGAQEVTQDAFVRAYQHLDQFDIDRAFYPWLATIAVRLSQNWLRQRGRTVRREGATIEAAKEPATSAHALASLITDERGRQLWQAVAMLPSGERTAVMLHYRDEMPLQDAARALGVTTGTIKTLLFRARRHLRERLSASLSVREEISK